MRCIVGCADLRTALNTVCKSLHTLTEPTLYAEVSWTKGLPTEVSHRRPRVHLLLRSILNRPELVKYIKRAKFCLYIEHHASLTLAPSLWQDGYDSGFTTNKEMAVATGLVHQAKLRLEVEWLMELQRGASDVIVAMSLSQLTDLQSLELEVSLQHEERPFVGSVFRQAITSAPGTLGHSSFLSLREIKVAVNTDNVEFLATVLDFD